MLKKLLTLSLVAVMLSVTAFASADVAVFTAAYAAEVSEEPVFSYDAEDIQYVTEITSAGTAKHEPVENLPTWSGEPAETIVGGTGTAEDPYLISDGAELAKFAELVNTTNETSGKYDNLALCAKLDRDINLAKVKSLTDDSADKNNWSSYSIGGVISYCGTFDGQGHNIYNYYFSRAETPQGTGKTGLFSSVGEGGKLKNFNMINAYTEFGAYAKNCESSAAMVCGLLKGDYDQWTEDTYIENIYVEGKATFSSRKRVGVYGSIVGQLITATVKNCVSNVNVDFSGLDWQTTAPNAGWTNYYKYLNSGTVYGGNVGIGGIVGTVANNGYNAARILNCGNMGDIVAPQNVRVGGVVGNIASGKVISSGLSATFKHLWNTGDINGGGCVAGIAGYTYGLPLTNCYNTGDVTATRTTLTLASGICNGTTAFTDSNNWYSTGVVQTVADENGATFNSTCGLLSTAGIKTDGTNAGSNTSTAQIYRSDLKSENDTITGTGKTISELQAMAEEEIQAIIGSGFVTNYNAGLPILATQKATVVLDEETYEIASAKSLSVKAAEAGYVALQVDAIIEGTTLSVTPAGGEAYTVEVSEAGAILLPTNGATEITVSAAEGNRFLVKKASDLSLSTLEATAIKATFASDESATIILALFNKTDNKLKTCKYAPYTVVTDGKISAVIDLTADDVSGCELRAYVWANDTLVPLRANVEVID